MSNNVQVTIIGGGNGGFAAAADLSIRGFRVVLYDLPQFESNLKDVRKLEGIELETLPSSGLKGGFAKLHKITTDIEDALKGSEIIFVIVPSFGLQNIARICAPFLEDDQIVVLAPGNFGGGIFFHNELRKFGCTKDIKIAEAECMMYACRKKDTSSVWIRGYKHNLGVAVFPSKDTDTVFKKLKAIYPTFIKRDNVLETSLSNPNAVVHVSLMLFNITNVENKRDMLIYHEGFTPSVGNIVSQMDKERMGLNNIKGFNLDPLSKIIGGWYAHQGAKGNTISEIQSSNPIYKWSKLPTSIKNRYITEDVPYGLIPMYKCLEKFGLPHSTMKAVADLSCIATDTDFYKEARTLKTLNLDDLDAHQLIHYVTYGEMGGKN